MAACPSAIAVESGICAALTACSDDESCRWKQLLLALDGDGPLEQRKTPFHAIIAAERVDVIGVVYAGGTLLCGTEVSVGELGGVSADGLGCGVREVPGHPSTSGCHAGGGHIGSGGDGGDSGSGECRHSGGQGVEPPQPEEDSRRWFDAVPLAPGSGAEGCPAGGVVWVAAETLSVSGRLSAEGNLSCAPSGGGSGGTIVA